MPIKPPSPLYDNRKNPAYQIDFSIDACGKHLPESKRRSCFHFGFSNPEAIASGATGVHCRGYEHEVSLIWSLVSGKLVVLEDGKDITGFVDIDKKKEKVQICWEMRRKHILKLVANFSPMNRNGTSPGASQRQYDFFLDGRSFFDLPKIYMLGVLVGEGEHFSTNTRICHSDRKSNSFPQRNGEDVLDKSLSSVKTHEKPWHESLEQRYAREHRLDLITMADLSLGLEPHCGQSDFQGFNSSPSINPSEFEKNQLDIEMSSLLYDGSGTTKNEMNWIKDLESNQTEADQQERLSRTPQPKTEKRNVRNQLNSQNPLEMIDHFEQNEYIVDAQQNTDIGMYDATAGLISTWFVGKTLPIDISEARSKVWPQAKSIQERKNATALGVTTKELRPCGQPLWQLIDKSKEVCKNKRRRERNNGGTKSTELNIVPSTKEKGVGTVQLKIATDKVSGKLTVEKRKDNVQPKTLQSSISGVHSTMSKYKGNNCSLSNVTSGKYLGNSHIIKDKDIYVSSKKQEYGRVHNPTVNNRVSDEHQSEISEKDRKNLVVEMNKENSTAFGSEVNVARVMKDTSEDDTKRINSTIFGLDRKLVEAERSESITEKLQLETSANQKKAYKLSVDMAETDKTIVELTSRISTPETQRFPDMKAENRQSEGEAKEEEIHLSWSEKAVDVNDDKIKNLKLEISHLKKKSDGAVNRMEIFSLITPLEDSDNCTSGRDVKDVENAHSFRLGRTGRHSILISENFPSNSAKCCLCFKDALELMVSCQCGNQSCDKLAHDSCLKWRKKNALHSVSHPCSPAPILPVILCRGIYE